MLFNLRRLAALFIALCIAQTTFAEDAILVSTLNTYFLFKPGADSKGQLAGKGPKDIDVYNRKIANLASLVAGCDVVALQEVGSAAEVADLARAVAGTAVFVQGKDTYTGEDVAFVHSLRLGFGAVHYGRVGMLDRELSKHLLLVIDGPSRRFNILNVHLVVAGRNPRKNEEQRAAIERWIEAARAQEPNSIFVVVGDMNTDIRGPVLAVGRDALEQTDWQYTHISRLRLDHMIAVGPAHWVRPTIVRPPYGAKPNDLNKMLWTDHFAVAAWLVP